MHDKQHWVDEILTGAREDLQAMVMETREALHDVVPIGMRLLSKKEQLTQFEGMTPEDHQRLSEEQGTEEYARYAQAQVENARQTYGDEYAAELLNALTLMQAGYMNPQVPQPEMM